MLAPVLFISHGSPELAVRQTPAHSFLKSFGETLEKPTAILVISAHWETKHVQVGGAVDPETIYDFGAFDPRLRQMTYPAPGAPELGDRVAALLEAAGIAVTRDLERGYDHGVWVPLSLLLPDADVPVVQLAIQPNEDPSWHHAIATHLRPLRDDGVLILASGALTHNLTAFAGQAVDAAPPAWVSLFNEWLAARIETHDLDALLDYRRAAPFAVENHPTDEHLLPLFSALGAASGLGAGTNTSPGQRLHTSYEHGVLAMDIWRWA